MRYKDSGTCHHWLRKRLALTGLTQAQPVPVCIPYQSLMRSTARLLTNASRSRANSISFVGLGRMGSEMAYNLFSKRIADENSRFVVFDAVPEVAAQFIVKFRKQFHSANITAVDNPEE